MNQYNINSISEKLIENITDLLDQFDITYAKNDRSINFPCPIHDGDNQLGSSIMLRDIGNWKCFTQHCHEKYGTSNGASIIQFLQALLSKYNNREFKFYETLVWAANYVGECKTENYTDEDESRTNFIQLSKYINRKKKSVPTFTPREYVKNFLKIPAEYYLKRGYGEDILCKFDVGYCFNTNKPYFDRIITPFYDDRGEYMIGCSGRNKYEQCPNCRMFHNPTTRCPITNEEKLMAAKWKHSSNFAADSYLYNYWNAKKHILNSHTVVLVEGTGDVWRLEEAGIRNSLGLLGAKLSANQKMILEESGAVNIVVATDNDDAGRKAATSIINNCQNSFNVHKLVYTGKDPGSLSIEEIKSLFIPFLERL